MKKSQRLGIIVELNAKNEKQALEEMGKVQNKKQQSQLQLESLENYQQEYKVKHQSINEAGVNISQLLEFRSFIDKLGKAIEEQQQTVLQINNELKEARENWEKLHQKTKSLQKVSDSALAEEVKLEEKREQNEQDDRATRMGRNNGTRNA